MCLAVRFFCSLMQKCECFERWMLNATQTVWNWPGTHFSAKDMPECESCECGKRHWHRGWQAERNIDRMKSEIQSKPEIDELAKWRWCRRPIVVVANVGCFKIGMSTNWKKCKHRKTGAKWKYRKEGNPTIQTHVFLLLVLNMKKNDSYRELRVDSWLWLRLNWCTKRIRWHRRRSRRPTRKIRREWTPAPEVIWLLTTMMMVNKTKSRNWTMMSRCDFDCLLMNQNSRKKRTS